MENRYLIQVCRDKLTDYIMKALICPDNLMGEECHIDTQSTYKDILILTQNSIINDLDNSEEILIEIVLTPNEVKNILYTTDSEDIFYTSKPLPISRIKKIYASLFIKNTLNNKEI